MGADNRVEADALLQIADIHKSFGGLRAVSGCSFGIADGSITGLIGPNGAGKTTTFNMIAGVFKPDAGRISFAGSDITGLPSHKLFDLGLVRTFQIPHEFSHLTVRDNLMTVPTGQPGERLFSAWLLPGKVRRMEEEIRVKADEVLGFLGLSHVADDPAGTLSGGQKKLLELGRAMMAEPRLVLLDEPGAGVNPTLLGQLGEMIINLNRERGYTFCIIEHNMDMIARLCSPVVVMAEGSVLTQGEMDEVRKDPRVLDAYLGESQ